MIFGHSFVRVLLLIYQVRMSSTGVRTLVWTVSGMTLAGGD